MRNQRHKENVHLAAEQAVAKAFDDFLRTSTTAFTEEEVARAAKSENVLLFIEFGERLFEDHVLKLIAERTKIVHAIVNTCERMATTDDPTPMEDDSDEPLELDAALEDLVDVVVVEHAELLREQDVDRKVIYDFAAAMMKGADEVKAAIVNNIGTHLAREQTRCWPH